MASNLESLVPLVPESKAGTELNEIEHVIFDFDSTLTYIGTDTCGKWGIHVEDDKNKYEDRQIKLNIKENTKHPFLLCAIFNKIKANGLDLSIASFHEGSRKDPQEKFLEGGPKYIRNYLTIGIDGFDFSNLRVRAYLPPEDLDAEKHPIPDKDNPVVLDGTNNVNHRKFRKNPFIEFLVRDANEQRKAQGNKRILDFSKKENRKHILLIDDNFDNIEAAEKEGYTTIYVDLEKPLDYMVTLLEQLGFTNEELIKLKIELLINEKFFKEKNERLGLAAGRSTGATNATDASAASATLYVQAENKVLMEINSNELKYLDEIITQRIKKQVIKENGELDDDFLKELISMKREELEADLNKKVEGEIYRRQYGIDPEQRFSEQRFAYERETEQQKQTRLAFWQQQGQAEQQIDYDRSLADAYGVNTGRGRGRGKHQIRPFVSLEDVEILKEPYSVVKIFGAAQSGDGFRFEILLSGRWLQRLVTWQQAKDIIEARGQKFYNADKLDESNEIIGRHLKEGAESQEKLRYTHHPSQRDADQGSRQDPRLQDPRLRAKLAKRGDPRFQRPYLIPPTRGHSQQDPSQSVGNSSLSLTSEAYPQKDSMAAAIANSRQVREVRDKTFASEADVAKLKDLSLQHVVTHAVNNPKTGYFFRYVENGQRHYRNLLVTWEQAKEIMDLRGKNFHNRNPEDVTAAYQLICEQLAKPRELQLQPESKSGGGAGNVNTATTNAAAARTPSALGTDRT